MCSSTNLIQPNQESCSYERKRECPRLVSGSNNYAVLFGPCGGVCWNYGEGFSLGFGAMKIKVKVYADGWQIVQGKISGSEAEVHALNELLDYIIPDPVAALKILKDHADSSKQTTEQASS
jgi:hypothetical protein